MAMKSGKWSLLLLLASVSISGTLLSQARASSSQLKPYRVLLVVENWNDPSSLVIDSQKDSFQPVAALLKAWSIPFDILRLDQQRLSNSYFFDRSGKIRYGTVLWMADASSYEGKNLVLLENAALRGTSLLTVGSRFLDPSLERVLGLKFREEYTATDPLEAAQPHFITRELAAQKMDRLDAAGEFRNRLWVEPQKAKALISQGKHPRLTVNQLEADASGIWIGVPAVSALRDSPYWRGLFFRSLTWAMGYLVLPNVDYAQRLILMFDDWGTSDKSFLSYWRYPTPSEELMRDHVITPLAQHRAVMAANVVTGFVDRKTQRIISPWEQRFTDAYGVPQDYASTRRGLKAAVDAGVLEIQSHGWTHMQPDLDSPPGPWWTADLEGEGSAGGWYEEFEDTRRGTEAPALVQLFHLKRSLEYLAEDFGQRPLSVIVGGGGWSKSLANHSAKVAAQAGFGLFDINERFFSLDHDLVLDMTGISPGLGHQYDHPLNVSRWPTHPDGPLVLLMHDRDIALQHDFVGRLLEGLPKGMATLGMNEYIGILHTVIESSPAETWQLSFKFEEPYSTYFSKHSSSWRLWLTDPLLERLKAVQEFSILVDGRRATSTIAADLLRQPLVIEIPAGMGQHVWKLMPAAK